MRRAEEGGMTPLFFGTKRAYYATLRVTRRLLARFGLTPARFDLLYALFRVPHHFCYQSDLRKALGVARSTISKMVTSLQGIGLVERLPPLEDMRQVDVQLTPEGRRRVSRAFRSLVRTGLIDLTTDSALTPDPHHWPHPKACSRARRWLSRLHSRLRNTFGDFATLHAAEGDPYESGWTWLDLVDRVAANRRIERRRASGDPFEWPAPMIE